MPSNEAGLPVKPFFRKSRFCASGECVEVAQRGDQIILRDSARPDDGGLLHYGVEEWRSFVRNIKAGEFGDLRS